MECRRIQEQLPAYLERALSASEEALIEAHLASCSQCRAARDDLVKAGQLVGSLDEVDAPSWLKQRVMARVREERARKEGAFWKRLSPLRVKLPAAAVAAVLMAGIAVYVFRAVEPDTVPLRHAGKETAGRAVQMEAPAVEAKKSAREAETPAPAPAAPPAQRPPEYRAEAKGAPAQDLGAPAVRPPDGADQARPVEPSAEAPRSDRAAPEMDEAVRRRESFTATQKEEKAALDAASEYTRGKRSDLLARPMVSGAPGRPPYVLSLHTRDLAKAVQDVEAILARSGARGIVPALTERTASVTAEIDAAKIPDLNVKLKALGDLRERHDMPAGPDGFVPIRIEILVEP